MGKMFVEVCLISARGLCRTSSFWKSRWFAVGWIDPKNKYCTNIDASGNVNPIWNTKFATFIDTSKSGIQDVALHVEVYSREPIFLREKLLGTTTILLKEFLSKYAKNSEVSMPANDVSSYQLRKRNSNKPQGFVDISMRISKEREESSSYQGNDGVLTLANHSSIINMAAESAAEHTQAVYTRGAQLPLAPNRQPENQLQTDYPDRYRMPVPRNYSNPSVGRPSYRPSRTPPPPPPPSNIGYIPTFLPQTNNLPGNYLNMPQTGAAPGSRAGPGFGAGIGAGTLAAGAVIFGEDFMSGFDVPSSLLDASLTISTDPPF